MKLVFLGPPGSGKGTQAQLLSQKYSITHISTGELFRENIKNKTSLGKLAAEYSSKGLLVPDDVTNKIVENSLMQTKGFILDGYPRTIPQAEFLNSIVKIDKVINFNLSDTEIIKRISGRRTCGNCGAVYHIDSSKPKKDGICDKCNGKLVQRNDEKPAIVKKRIEVYKQQTEPLIDYYKKKSLLVHIDAYPSIEKINQKLTSILKKAALLK